MKKLLLMAMLTSMLILTLATTAFAAEPYYHGDFASDTTGCAKCHVTHAASASRLLVSGTNQTEFCLYCHSDLLKSPYNAKDGKIATPTGVMPSISGGFVRSYDFDTKTYDETAGAVDGNYISTDSMHGVETYDGSVWKDTVDIPGGSSALSGDFRCGSCHDPHAGGAYVDGSLMPRLLRPLGTVTKANMGAWTFNPVGDSNTMGYKTRVVSGYGDGTGEWCAGCHDLFNQKAHLAGQAKEVTTNKYMHRMNFVVTTGANGQDAIQNKNIQQMALSTGKQLICLTCHRAHGTASKVTSGTVFNRAATYKLTNDTLSATNESSVLLREKNRNVCYDCHGAAVTNTPTQQGS